MFVDEYIRSEKNVAVWRDVVFRLADKLSSSSVFSSVIDAIQKRKTICPVASVLAAKRQSQCAPTKSVCWSPSVAALPVATTLASGRARLAFAFVRQRAMTARLSTTARARASVLARVVKRATRSAKRHRAAAARRIEKNCKQLSSDTRTSAKRSISRAWIRAALVVSAFEYSVAAHSVANGIKRVCFSSVCSRIAQCDEQR